MIYVGGSLRSPRPGEVAQALREDGHRVFDSWRAPGPDADDHWKAYEQSKGLTFREALSEPAALHVYNFDKAWLDCSQAFVAVMPCGKSAFSEAGYMAFHRKMPVFILLDDQDRWDVMFNFFRDRELNPQGGIYEDIQPLRDHLALLFLN